MIIDYSIILIKTNQIISIQNDASSLAKKRRDGFISNRSAIN